MYDSGVATVLDAIQIAAQAHAGQTNRAGEPYILHPIRVMLRLKSDEERITGILHDVVEDTPWTFEMLREAGFSEEILAAVDCLTRRENESYDEFVERIKVNPLARRVKFADLEDNMSLQRTADPTGKDVKRMARYRRAWDTLSEYESKLQDV